MAKTAFARIFDEEAIHAAFVEGDSFHRYTREEMRQLIQKAEREQQQAKLSHFNPEANYLDKLEALFKEYGEQGTGTTRAYLHTFEDALPYNQMPGTFTSWKPLPDETELMFYEGLHGGVVTQSVNVAQHVDLLIGVTPIINLEWIQKIRRDINLRGYSEEAAAHAIIDRMEDYVRYIVPQFSRTHINFQRVPMVDTSNPFIESKIPTPDESLIVIHFRDAKGVDFPYYMQMIQGAFMSRPDTIVVPGGKADFAFELVMRPLIQRLLEDKKWF